MPTKTRVAKTAVKSPLKAAPASKKKTTSKEPIGVLIDNVWALREAKRKLEKEVEEISGKITEAENIIIDRLDKEKTDRAASSRASVSISENVVPQVDDWETFMKEVVIKKGLTHLVERRASVTGCREVWEQGGALPGLKPFIKRKLNLRTIND